MNAVTFKPNDRLARLHLGCGESLSQLLPSAVAPRNEPVSQKSKPLAKMPKREEKQ